MRFSQLSQRRVALWGWGRENRAAYEAIRAWQRQPDHRVHQWPLTLFCTPEEANQASTYQDPTLSPITEITAEQLCQFEVVIKSPGISLYQEPAQTAIAHGVLLIGSTAIWFAEHANTQHLVERCVCVTGTKGKSTTSALLAHLLRDSGQMTALAGNIGLPLLELPPPAVPASYWVIELSSFQTRDVAVAQASPALSIVLNLFPEHLDWHGQSDRYFADKLSLITHTPRHPLVLNANDLRLAGLPLSGEHVHWFNTPQGWHARQERIFIGNQFVYDLSQSTLRGPHQASNVCAVLTALDVLGLNARHLIQGIASFQPLPHRLQILGDRDGITWVNDSISTTPEAARAGLACFSGQCVILLVGGYDRGLDWRAFAAQLVHDGPLHMITMGPHGARIYAELADHQPSALAGLHHVIDLTAAVRLARDLLKPGKGVVLLSPGAPSFGLYTDYIARGQHFATLAGFAIPPPRQIPGLGWA